MAELDSEWTVYIIRADDDSLYTGITTDLERRWQQHSGLRSGAKFFRGRKPAALVYLENGHSRSSASRREAAIKQLKRPAKELLLLQADRSLLERIGSNAQRADARPVKIDRAKKSASPGVGDAHCRNSDLNQRPGGSTTKSGSTTKKRTAVSKPDA